MAAVVMMLSVLGQAQSQSQSGQIKGRLADGVGNPISNTSIVARNVSTGAEHRATTDAQGQFIIAQLEPGAYLVQNTQTRVDSGTTTNLELQQNANGNVGITAETVVADSTTSQIRSAFSPTTIELQGEPNAVSKTGEYYGAYNLSLRSEGVTPGEILQNGVGPSVGGRPNTSNNFQVEGVDNNNRLTPGPLVTVSNEATTEFALLDAADIPAFGYSTGGQLNSSLFSAGNDWHGSIYDYLNNRKLNAVEPVLTERRNQRYDLNRMGGKVGGPLMRDKLFAFIHFEYMPLRTENVSLTPLLAPTGTGFAALAASTAVSTANLNLLRNNVSTTDTPVRFTTINGVSVPLGIVRTGFKMKRDQYDGVARVDWVRSPQSRLSARYVHNDIGTDAFAPSLPAFQTPGHTRALLGTVSYSHLFATTLVANGSVGYNRLHQTVGEASSVSPNIAIQDLGVTLGSAASVRDARVNTYQASGSIDATIPRHRIQAGGDWRGVISTYKDFSSDAGNLGYSSLGRFLLDLPPDVTAQRTFGSAAFHGNQNLLYLFAQDKIRFMGTDVELGLGYQYAEIPASLRRRSLLNATRPDSDTLNFAPRFGVAWAPSALQTVIRASFAVTYDAINVYSPFVGTDMLIGARTTASPSTSGFLASGGVPFPSSLAASIGTFIPDQELPYVMHWTASATQGFFGKLATEIKYMGHRGVHLPRLALLNGFDRVDAANSLPVFFTAPDQATLNQLTTTQQSLAARTDVLTALGFTSPILMNRQDGTSWYNAVSLRLAETFTAGTQISANYTYSDNRTDSTGTMQDLAFGRRMEQAPWNRKHRATVTGLLDVASMLPPTLGAVRDVLANLSIMTSLTYASHERVPLYSGLDTGMSGNAFGSGIFVNPNGVAGTGTGVSPLTNRSGQTVAFLANSPTAQFVSGGVGTFSTARPTLRLDDTRNVDLSIVKRFTVRDRASVEVRGDAYNVFNHAQFTGLPITTLGSGMRSIMPPSFTLASNPQFNNIRGNLSGNPRSIQLALRVVF